jgi:hypothetical protein
MWGDPHPENVVGLGHLPHRRGARGLVEQVPTSRASAGVRRCSASRPSRQLTKDFTAVCAQARRVSAALAPRARSSQRVPSSRPRRRAPGARCVPLGPPRTSRRRSATGSRTRALRHRDRRRMRERSPRSSSAAPTRESAWWNSRRGRLVLSAGLPPCV